MSKMYTYNPRKVTVTLGGIHNVSGYSDDSFVSIEPQSSGVAHNIGADGEVVRSIDPNDLYVLKLKLQQTSATNQWLQNQYDKDMQTGRGTFSALIKDLLGGEQFSAGYCWVAKPAKWERGKNQKEREWQITCFGAKFKK